jgi:3D (Asp-Asp-Asp) domain-containing protein
MNSHDALGCPVSPMRTAAVDPSVVARRSIIFIKETVGMPLPGGGTHDGYWYASDVGGAIHGQRIDLYTGSSSASMRPMLSLSTKGLSVTKVGDFSGCPPMDGGQTRVASAAR